MSHERAWCAGFFDGEGSVYVRHTARAKGGNGKYYPLLTVEANLCQVRREPLERFVTAIEMSRVSGPYKPKTANSRPYYKWNIAGRPSVLRAAQFLWPYLSEPKKEQFRKCWEELSAKATVKSPKLIGLPE